MSEREDALRRFIEGKPGPRSVADHLELERELQESGLLTEEEMTDSIDYCSELAALGADQVGAMDFFLQHMPPEEEPDLTLVVLKGHLLLEHQTWRFISSRMLTQLPDLRRSLESSAAIWLAQSLCLSNEAPTTLWTLVRRLNKIRNDIAHNLEPTGLSDKVKAFVKECKSTRKVSGNLVGCLAVLYSEISELCRISNGPDFSVRRPRR